MKEWTSAEISSLVMLLAQGFSPRKIKKMGLFEGGQSLTKVIPPRSVPEMYKILDALPEEDKIKYRLKIRIRKRISWEQRFRRAIAFFETKNPDHPRRTCVVCEREYPEDKVAFDWCDKKNGKRHYANTCKACPRVADLRKMILVRHPELRVLKMGNATLEDIVRLENQIQSATRERAGNSKIANVDKRVAKRIAEVLQANPDIQCKECKRCKKEIPATTEFFYPMMSGGELTLEPNCRRCKAKIRKERRSKG